MLVRLRMYRQFKTWRDYFSEKIHKRPVPNPETNTSHVFLITTTTDQIPLLYSIEKLRHKTNTKSPEPINLPDQLGIKKTIDLSHIKITVDVLNFKGNIRYLKTIFITCVRGRSRYFTFFFSKTKAIFPRYRKPNHHPYSSHNSPPAPRRPDQTGIRGQLYDRHHPPWVDHSVVGVLQQVYILSQTSIY